MNSKIRWLATATVLAVGVAFGKDCVWTGAGLDGKFETAANWENSAAPAYGDVLIFRPAGDLTVTFAANAVVLSAIRFESGNTTLALASGVKKANLGFKNPSAGIYVASEATATIYNRVCAEKQGMDFWVDGGGDIEFLSDHVDNVGYFNTLDIKAGKVTFTGGAGEGLRNWWPRLTIIRDGATFYAAGGSGIFSGKQSYGYGKWPAFQVDEGGTFDMYYATNWKLGSISGSGLVRIGGACTCTFTLDQGPVTFDGTCEYYKDGALNLTFSNTAGVSAETFKYVLASAEAFSGVSVTDADALRFSPVSDTYTLALWRGTDALPTLTLEDTDGNPIALNMSSFGKPSRMIGKGSLTILSGSSRNVTGDVAGFDGTLTFGSATTYTIGDNADAANDADLSTVAGVKAVSADSKVDFKNVNPFTLPGLLTGLGRYRFYGSTVFEQFHPTGRDVDFYGTTEIHGGSGLTASIYNFQDPAAKAIVLDGKYIRDYVMSTIDPISSLPLHKGVVTMAPAAKRGELVIGDGAHYWIEHVDSTGEPHITLNEGGNLYRVDNCLPAATVTMDDPNRFAFNGGILNVSFRSVAFSTGTISPFGDASTPLTVTVGEKPALMRTCESYAFGQTVNINRPFTRASGVEQDGGFTRLVGEGTFKYARPFDLNGPIAFLDGKNVISAAAATLASTPDWFGTGSVFLRNAVLSVAGLDNGCAVNLASGTDEALTYEGASTLQFGRSADAAKAKTVSIGGLRRAGAGSVLCLWDYPLFGSGLFDGTKSKLLVNGVLENQACGISRQPIVIFNEQGNRCYFTTCKDGEIRAFDNYKTTWDPANFTSDDVVWIEQQAVAVPKNTDVHVGALKLAGASSTLTVNAGATLHVGNGTDPAIVFVDKPDIYGASGSIDFGTSEGIFCGIQENTVYQPVIKGSAGVTFTAPSYLNSATYRAARVINANTYTGGTHVNSVRVSPENALAFGTGDVYAGGGQDYGGRIAFMVEGLTYANAFHVAGWGRHDADASDNGKDSSDKRYGYGVLDFLASAEISGPVEVVEASRFCCLNAGTVGTISGEISGDRIQAYNGAGVLAFTHANSYTGGTEIVASTIRISGAGTLGTGEVLLDGGTLAIDKDGAFSLPNKITGKGTVRLEGKGVVTLAGGLETIDYNGRAESSFTLALGNRKRFIVPTLDGFAAVTTDRTAPVDLYVLDGKPFVGTLPANVTYHAGEYEPLGMTLIVR